MPHDEERRGVWCEDLDHDRLADPQLLDALGVRRIELLASVRPTTRGAPLRRLLDACDRARVRLALWPMLDDGDGRWASTSTMHSYCDFVDDLLDEVGGATACRSVVYDLEPPIAQVRAALDRPSTLIALARAQRARSASARARLAESTQRVASFGLTSTAAIVPLLLVDDGTGLEQLLGTPASAGSFSRQHAMMYTSLVEGYAPRAVRRADARALLFAVCEAATRRHGARAAVSLGITGPGALGDERPYRDLDELADDVAIARAAGVRDLALFDLRGALARPPLERWLDALLTTPPLAEPPAPTPRGRAALGGVALAARIATLAFGAAHELGSPARPERP